ncbi:hypothetical protein HanRHA438_Chr03g0117631 [Helianthus annuus]|nr:hypothetical protein HanRHA438_Chr03g0117631 [Helianthus annuus]
MESKPRSIQAHRKKNGPNRTRNEEVNYAHFHMKATICPNLRIQLRFGVILRVFKCCKSGREVDYKWYL